MKIIEISTDYIVVDNAYRTEPGRLYIKDDYSQFKDLLYVGLDSTDTGWRRIYVLNNTNGLSLGQQVY